MSKGLETCAEALKRLIEGNPVYPKHVGLSGKAITSSIVSVEAGFDKGYLKKSRPSHLPIIAKIEAHRSVADKHGVNDAAVQRLNKKKHEALERRAISAENQRDVVLEQNLRLWERIKQLETSGVNMEPLCIASSTALGVNIPVK